MQFKTGRQAHAYLGQGMQRQPRLTTARPSHQPLLSLLPPRHRLRVLMLGLYVVGALVLTRPQSFTFARRADAFQ